MSTDRRPTLGEYQELWMAALLRRLPVSWTSAIGAYLGARLGRRGIAAKRLWVDRLHRNLELLCGQQDPAERERSIVAYTSRIGRQYAEYMVLQKIVREGRSGHRTLCRDGWPDVVLAFHDGEEIGPRMLSRIAKHTGLTPDDL